MAGGVLKHIIPCRPLLLVLCLALGLSLMTGCAAKSPAPPPSGRTVKTVKRQPMSPKAAGIIRTARVLVGYPYKWGGAHPNVGFDCSGLIHFVYAQHGIRLPRVSWQQFNAGSPVRRENLRPGDLVFYKIDKNGKSLHGGIVTDRATFVHAPSSGKRVMESPLNSPYWRKHYLGARRVF